MNAYRVGAGAPEPLGVTADAAGLNIAVFSANATMVELCLFDATGQEEIARIVLPERTGDVFHGHVIGLGEGTRYGLRAHGPWDPAHGHRFNAAKLLVDPYAMRLDRPFALHDSMFDQRARGASRDDVDSGPFVPKAIVETLGRALDPLHLPFRWNGQVFYELHVRGYTMLNQQVPLDVRGTFAGLADPAAIAHLVRLGITTVELMPAMAWIDERHLPPLELGNYWGYNPVVLGAPDPRLAPGGFAEIRRAVEALHDAGIGVVLDVVLNHTGESDIYGPTVSLRGLDNATYYRHAAHDPGLLLNDAGTGNTLALESAPVLRLAMDNLRRWATTGLDGFRFDLAATLGRTAHGFDIHAPFFGAIGQDPLLRDRALIAEPWDIGPGGYQVGQFPAEWAEWNDHFRDTIRKFWRGDRAMVGELATRLAGSADVFAARRRPLSRAVNFVTAHDGFTLADLVSYERKHNEANGENNQDGTADNQSWNHGIEGPTDDPAIIARRQADARALLATLLVARGTPMLTMGDEGGRSQGGNNNAYAQDNALTWLDWSRMDEPLVDFTASLVALRHDHPALRGDAPLTGHPLDASTIPDVEWRGADGTPVAWNDPENRILVAVFYAAAARGREADRVVLILNGDSHAADIHLPEARDEYDWEVRIDTARAHTGTHPRLVEERLTVPARSVSVIVEKRMPDAPRRSPDPALLERLAVAAGIAAHWQDVSGVRHEVPDDTKRALLKAMRLPADTRGDASDSLVWLSEQNFARSVPEALVVREGASGRLQLGGAAARATQRIELHIRLEDGEERSWPVAPDEGERAQLPRPDGRFALVRHVGLPPLPLGRHRLRLDGESCLVTVAPASCHVPPLLAGGGRVSGIVAHLYALRRARDDQGIGDFSALAALAEAASKRGAALVGLNPLHALFPHDRERASPYYPSDRRFLDPIYIDVAGLAGFDESEALRAAREAAAPVFAALGAGAVDYSAVWAAKQPVLAAAFDAFDTRGDAAFDHFVAEGGEALRRFAIFTALAAQQGSEGWRNWPEGLRQPDAPAVRAFAEANVRAVRFALWQQWTADRQLQSAAIRASEAGLALGFYRDLAVGTAPDGAEAWAEAERLMQGVTVGAPPDPLGPEGQNWNLPPPDPLALRADGYAGFARNVAANMRYAGALRIDHVMGLRRLFLIPVGASAAEGAYLAYPFEDLAGQVALESHRARCLVIGEDLGTVPFGMREQLSAENMLSYRVLWFERSTAGFLPPGDYPSLAAACVSTHDLPTLAGWWQGADIAERLDIGLEDDASATAVRSARRLEKETLAQALLHEGLIAGLPDFEAPLDDAFVAAVHAYVARSRSMLALTQIDDLAGETVGVNLPGTDRERPNWRRRLSTPVEEVLDTVRARAALDAMKAERG